MVEVKCYCGGQICGLKDIGPDDRSIHFDTEIRWGKTDARQPWTGSYDFGSFSCIARWAQDRADDHDGRVLTGVIDKAPVGVSVPPAGDETMDVKEA